MYEQIAAEHKLNREEYQLISRSTITKAEFYKPELDYYHSDIINF